MTSFPPLIWSLSAAALATLVAPSVPAQELARVPVRIIEGKLLVACDVSTRFRRLTINLFVEYDTQCGLQLHNRVAFPLRAENAAGQPTPITIHFGDYEIEVERREQGDQEYYDEFTRYHSEELAENAAAGTIGAQLLSRYFVTFDLANGLMEIGPPRAEDAAARDPVPGQTVVPLSEVNTLSWLPVRYQDGTPGALALGGSRYDTVVDLAVCDRWDAPAGNLPSLRLGDLELTEFVALRPEEVIQVHPNGVAGVLGLNLLEHFRIGIDRVNRVAYLQQTAAADYPEEDFAFFEAMIDEEADPLADYLEEYPAARLSREAADLLLDYRLDEQADDSDVRRAIEHVNGTYPGDLRTTAMVDLMKELVEARYPEHAIYAGELGIESGREDRYPNAVHELHAEIGALLIEAGEDEGNRAWRHLLSAAFGLPDDGMTNLNLGRYYEGEGRLRRAFSRYVQAVIKPESGPAALEALHRLQSQMSGEERMSIDKIEKLIAGKVHGFGAATLFQPEPGRQTNRVALIEFFTNANLGDATRGGSIGGALGNDGLVSHFTDEHAAFITYHLDAPELVPMTTEVALGTAELYGANPAMHIVNGLHRGPGAGRWRDKESIYSQNRDLVIGSLREASPYAIEIRAEIVSGELRGTATVSGPAVPDLRVQIVMVERGVLFPGRSEIVIHRNVARAMLTDDVRGVQFAPEDDVMAIDFAARLVDVTAANERFLDQLTAAGRGQVMKMSMDIDPDQVSVVAFVRNGKTLEVLQARQVPAAGDGAPR